MSISGYCREKYSKKAYSPDDCYRKYEDIPENEINPFWDGRLYGLNKEFIEGFDYCVDNFINDFFKDDDFTSNLQKIVGYMYMKNIDFQVIYDDRTLFDFSSDELNTMSKETILIKAIKDEILRRAETCRDATIMKFIADEASKNSEKSIEKNGCEGKV